jgi:hypothetical protein
MRKMLLAVLLFLAAALSQAQTINVYSYGDYPPAHLSNAITVLTSQAVSILSPTTYGPQAVYWYDEGEFPAGPNSQDSSLELVTLTALQSGTVTISGMSYTLLTVTRAAIPKAHKINHINALQFSTSLSTATVTLTPTITQTPTITPTPVPTSVPSNYFVSSNSNPQNPSSLQNTNLQFFRSGSYPNFNSNLYNATGQVILSASNDVSIVSRGGGIDLGGGVIRAGGVPIINLAGAQASVSHAMNYGDGVTLLQQNIFGAYVTFTNSLTPIPVAVTGASVTTFWSYSYFGAPATINYQCLPGSGYVTVVGATAGAATLQLVGVNP